MVSMAVPAGPLVGPPPVGPHIEGHSGPLSYAHAVSRSHDVNPSSSSFKHSMRYPVDVDGDFGFIFSEAEMNKAAEDFRLP